jgi:hypothetical protein
MSVMRRVAADAKLYRVKSTNIANTAAANVVTNIYMRAHIFVSNMSHMTSNSEARDIDARMSRVRTFRTDADKVLTTIAKNLDDLHVKRQLNQKLSRAHGALVKNIADFVVMIKNYDERLSKNAQLIAAYSKLFDEMQGKLEHLQRVCDELARAAAMNDNNGRDTSLGAHNTVQTVKFIDEELRKLRKGLNEGATARHIDEALAALYDTYNYVYRRQGNERPVVPTMFRNEKGQFATPDNAMRSFRRDRRPPRDNKKNDDDDERPPRDNRKLDDDRPPRDNDNNNFRFKRRR